MLNARKTSLAFGVAVFLSASSTAAQGDGGEETRTIELLEFCDTFVIPAAWYDGRYTAEFSPFRMTMTGTGAFYQGEGGKTEITLHYRDEGEFLIGGLPKPMPDWITLHITGEDEPEWRFSEDERLWVSPFVDQNAPYNSENFMRDLRMSTARQGLGEKYENCRALSDLGRMAGRRPGVSGDLDVVYNILLAFFSRCGAIGAYGWESTDGQAVLTGRLYLKFHNDRCPKP